MIPHLLIHRVVKIEHVTHLICVSGANHVNVARDQSLDEASLAKLIAAIAVDRQRIEYEGAEISKNDKFQNCINQGLPVLTFF